MSATPHPRFDIFYRYDALTQLLTDYAAAYPGLVSVASIGKSHEGRDIWVVVVTNAATGIDTDTPAPPVCTTCISWSLAMAATARSPSCSTPVSFTCAHGSTPTVPSWHWPTGRVTSARRRGVTRMKKRRSTA